MKVDRSISYDLREAANQMSHVRARLRGAAARYEQAGDLNALGHVHEAIRQARESLDNAYDKANVQAERLIDEVIALPAEALCKKE